MVKYDKTMIAKGSIQNLMWSSTGGIVNAKMTSFLVLNHERIEMDFKSQMIKIDEINLPIIASTSAKH